jgi:hypothetical protein
VSSANLEVIFEGPAVNAGTIGAQLLADSLAGHSEIFTRVNALVNGTESNAVVLVRSDFKRGSFVAGLQYVQTFVEEAQRVLATHPGFDASGLVGIIGFVWKRREVVESLLDFYKRLKGEKPKDTKKVDGNNVELTLGDGNKVVVNNNVFHLHNDPIIVNGFERLTTSLRRAEVDRIIVKHGASEPVVIEKPEAEYFEATRFQLETENETGGQQETILIVSRVSFVEGTTWSFIENGATLNAKIEDPEFWAQVHHNNLRFGEGDRLRVLLHWKVVQIRSKKLVPKNTILKVYEVLPRPTQLQLPEVARTSRRKFKLD